MARSSVKGGKGSAFDKTEFLPLQRNTAGLVTRALILTQSEGGRRIHIYLLTKSGL